MKITKKELQAMIQEQVEKKHNFNPGPNSHAAISIYNSEDGKFVSHAGDMEEADDIMAELNNIYPDKTFEIYNPFAEEDE